MKKLRAKLTPDYDGQSLRQAIAKMLADRVIPKLTGKKRAKRGKPQTTEEPTGEIDVPSDVAAWFLGPRGENVDLFSELVEVALNDHVFWRRNFHPSDPSPITESMKREEDYLNAVDVIKTEFYALLAQLKKSGPFASMRYQGHMTWDRNIARDGRLFRRHALQPEQRCSGSIANHHRPGSRSLRGSLPLILPSGQ